MERMRAIDRVLHDAAELVDVDGASRLVSVPDLATIIRPNMHRPLRDQD